MAEKQVAKKVRAEQARPDGTTAGTETATTGQRISALKNLGPATESAFARAGIHDAETLRALGTDAAYGRLLASGQRPHFISFYVLEMALQGRPWNDCRGAEKEALRKRFDALCAKVKPDPAQTGLRRLEAELDAIGVIARPAKASKRPRAKPASR
ncbi:TfoX/Sxy family protein [Halodurantibacterium flavum]|uniref:TfoX/Sxy family protein n=1 Tax=Halodurantibacterium flavum TaxID=1382802 RepID=A0ABW4S3I9_9RHOB